MTSHSAELLVILHLTAYEGGAECSETSTYKIQTPGNYPEESIQHSEHGEKFEIKKIINISGLRTVWYSEKTDRPLKTGPQCCSETSVTITVTYLLTPWSRVLLEKLTSKLCR